MSGDRDPAYALKAAKARAECRADGYADCIHYAPNWDVRSEALYDRMRELSDQIGLGLVPNGVALLHDGRMVLPLRVCEYRHPLDRHPYVTLVEAVPS